MADVKQEMSWLASRMEEKSTYAGLTVVVSLLLPVVAKYVPVLASADATSIVNNISMIGIGLGGLLAIAFPERKA